MKVVYTAGEGDVQEFRFTPDDVRQSQAEMIEKRYGKAWDDFLQDVRGGSAQARRVLLWHLLRQAHHTLRYEDTPDFRMGDLTVSYDLDELLAVRDRVLKSSLSQEDKEQVLAALDIDITEAMGDDPATEPATVTVDFLAADAAGKAEPAGEATSPAWPPTSYDPTAGSGNAS